MCLMIMMIEFLADSENFTTNLTSLVTFQTSFLEHSNTLKHLKTKPGGNKLRKTWNRLKTKKELCALRTKDCFRLK
jgi:hypothetical protein